MVRWKIRRPRSGAIRPLPRRSGRNPARSALKANARVRPPGADPSTALGMTNVSPPLRARLAENTPATSATRNAGTAVTSGKSTSASSHVGLSDPSVAIERIIPATATPNAPIATAVATCSATTRGGLRRPGALVPEVRRVDEEAHEPRRESPRLRVFTRHGEQPADEEVREAEQDRGAKPRHPRSAGAHGVGYIAFWMSRHVTSTTLLSFSACLNSALVTTS